MATDEGARPTHNQAIRELKIAAYTAACLTSLLRISELATNKESALRNLLFVASHGYTAYHSASSAYKGMFGQPSASTSPKQGSKIIHFSKLLFYGGLAAFNGFCSGIMGYQGLIAKKHYPGKTHEERALSPKIRLRASHDALSLGWNAKLALMKAYEEYKAPKKPNHQRSYASQRVKRHFPGK